MNEAGLSARLFFVRPTLRMHGHDTARGESRILSWTLLALLLCGDVAFFVLHGYNRLSGSGNPLFSLAVDGGYAEMFQYLKEFSIAVVLMVLYRWTREGIYGAWALLFTYLLLDDALTIHETAGRAVAAHVTVQAFGFRAQDFGELMVSASAGAAFLALLGPFYARSTDRARDVSKDLAVLLGVLAFFGVLVDLVHLALEAHVRALTIVEDGGEMLAMSITVSYVVHLLGARTHDAGQLWRSVVGQHRRLRRPLPGVRASERGVDAPRASRRGPVAHRSLWRR